MQMGLRSSAGNAYRLSILLAALVVEDLNRGLEELIRGEPKRWGELEGWRAERRARLPGVKGADRPYHFRNFQDDFNAEQSAASPDGRTGRCSIVSRSGGWRGARRAWPSGRDGKLPGGSSPSIRGPGNSRCGHARKPARHMPEFASVRRGLRSGKRRGCGKSRKRTARRRAGRRCRRRTGSMSRKWKAWLGCSNGVCALPNWAGSNAMSRNEFCTVSSGRRTRVASGKRQRRWYAPSARCAKPWSPSTGDRA